MNVIFAEVLLVKVTVCVRVVAKLPSELALSVTPEPEVEPPPSFLRNVAVTLLAASIVTWQLPVPLQAPDQPLKAELEAGVAESVTTVPAANVVAQVVPQLIAAGEDVTVPVALLAPVVTTVRA